MNRKFQLLEMLKSEPNNSFLNFALAKEFESEGNLYEACKQFELLENIDPDYTGLYYHLSRNYAQLGDLSKAIQIAEKGIQICLEQNDQHSLSELQSLLMNYKLDEFD
ncbi:MAG: tetratricopeptide repeat protein [Saprospiraceae bacterium]|nr:tetratricopeptide repeat protein [Saprospiraceae bacterium]